MGITIVARKIERVLTEAGKAAMKNLIRTNDLTASKRKDEKGGVKTVFKISNQKFNEMELAEYALTAGVNESGNIFLVVVPSDTEGAIMKGKKGAKKSQEFVYKELESLLNIQDEKHGFDLTRSTESIEGVISVWEVTPAELVRKPEKADSDTEDEAVAELAYAGDEDEDEGYED